MSYLSLNPKNDIISKSNHKGYKYERSQYSKKSLSRTGYQSVGISQRIGDNNWCSCKMEYCKNAKNSREMLRVHVKISSTKSATRKDKRIQRSITKNIVFSVKKYNILIIISYLSKNTAKYNYNPIVPNNQNGAKGFKMSKIQQIDLRKTATVDDIINLEQKILGIRGILDAFGTSIDLGLENPQEALALVRDTITHTIIQKDIEMLKDKIEYMFGVCASIYHGEVA